MKRTTAVFVLAVLVGTLGTAHAESTRYSSQFDSCTKNAKSFAQQNDCDVAEVVVQKRRLTAAYNRIAKHADPTELAALNKAQQDWITWRDSTYGYLGEHAGEVGSTNYVITQGFLLNAILEQANLLESVADSRGL